MSDAPAKPISLKPPRTWSPQDRQLWLAAKGAPPDAVLMTHQEMAVLTQQLRNGLAQIALHDAHLSGVAEALGLYNASEPDLPNGAGSAVHDAQRFKSAVDRAKPALERATDVLRRLASSRWIPFVYRVDLVCLHSELRAALDHLRAKEELRRERRPLIDQQEVLKRALTRVNATPAPTPAAEPPAPGSN